MILASIVLYYVIFNQTILRRPACIKLPILTGINDVTKCLVVVFQHKQTGTRAHALFMYLDLNICRQPSVKHFR